MLIKSRKKKVECRSCGSSLLRRDGDRINCMVCCAGLPDILGPEVAGHDYETILGLFGREFGSADSILPKLNTPGVNCSFIRFNQDEYVLIRQQLESHGKKIKDQTRNH